MRKGLSIWFLLTCGAFCASSAQSAPANPFGYDLGGRAVSRLSSPGTEAVVLFFLATDCPISNRYAPEIQRLKKEFAGQPVAFWLVYPNATESAEAVVRHQAAYGLGGATLLHASGALLAETHARITPEAAVLVPAGSGSRLVYAGRVDDRYVDIGRERPRATRHDLEEAITAVLASRPVAPPGGPPVGCGIVSEAALRKP